MLASLPLSCQSAAVSPYLDHSLFHFDDKLIAASDRHKPWSEHPIKFMSRRRPNVLKFKLQPSKMLPSWALPDLRPLEALKPLRGVVGGLFPCLVLLPLSVPPCLATIFLERGS